MYSSSQQSALVDDIAVLYKEISQLTALPEGQVDLLRSLVAATQLLAQHSAQRQSADGAMVAEVSALKDEVERLRGVNSAYDQQLQWLKDRIALSRSATGQIRLKATLKQTLDAAVGITRADTGSIFLLDPHQVVTESILSRPNTTEEERSQLVGQVLEKGLAGWVTRRRIAALVPDVQLDTRWISLPDQPYKVSSVLCVPLLQNERVFGVLTLTHPDARYFTQQDSDLVTAIAAQIALLLENSTLSGSNRDLKERLNHSQDFFRQMLKSSLVAAFLLQNNKFVLANQKLATLFDYARDDLLRLPSIASLLAYEDRDRVYADIRGCLNGKVGTLNLSFRISRRQGQVMAVAAQAIVTDFQGQPALVGMMAEAAPSE